MLQLAAIVLVGISAALSGFIITDSIAPQRTPAETAVAAVASVDLPEPTTVTNLPVFDPVEFEAVPGAGFPTAAPVQQPVAVIPSPVADTSLVQALAATVTTLAAQFGALEKLEGRLSGLEARPVSSLSPAVSGGGAAAPVYVNTHGLTQKIDRLENTTITNATISGGSVTAASILGTIANVIDSAVASIDSLTADTLVATNAAFTNSTTTNATTTNHYISNLMAAAANVTGDLTVSGTITGGTLSVSGLSSGGAVEAPYFTATSTTATSTFAGGLTAGTNGLTVLQNGNVGIGTTNPAGNLHVRAASSGGATPFSNANLAVFESSIANGISILVPNVSNSRISFGSPSDNVGANITYNQSTKTMKIGAGSPTAGGITQLLYDQGQTGVTVAANGNVGIGHTSPRTKLDVVGSVLATRLALNYIDTSNPAQVFIIPDATSTTGALIYSSGAQSVPLAEIRYAGAATNFDLLKIATGNGSTPVLNVGASGNIGIGTSAPSQKLEVAGHIKTTGGNLLVDTGAAALAQIGLNGDIGSFASLFNIRSTGSIPIAFSTGSTLGTESMTGSERMRIDSSGNVGIGTTSPYRPLSVSGSGVFSGGDVLASTVTATSTVSGAGFNATALATGYQLNGTSVLSYSGGVVRLDDLGGGFALRTGSTNRLFADTSGNIGVGNSSPTFKLDVTGNARFTSLVDAAHFVATSTTATSTFAGGLTAGINGLTVLQNGNVGIGTTAPSTVLQVNGGLNTTDTLTLRANANNGLNRPGIVLVNATPAPLLRIGSASTDGESWFNALGGLHFGTGNVAYGANERLTILSSGNVGIGTTTPWRRLSVTGTVGFDGLAGATGAGSLCLDANKQVVYNAGSDACLPSLRDTKHNILALSLSGIDTIEKLEPVSFIYNEGDGRVRLGFIAENTAAVQSELATYNAAGAISGIDDRAVLSVVVKAIKEMWAHVTGQDQRIAAHDARFAALEAEVASLKSQLPTAGAAAPTATTTAPIELLINGNNPALLTVGDSYVDLGATASSSDTTVLALGIRTFVDGTAVETVALDTSNAATTTITYRVIDSDGDGAVLAEAERTVVVRDPVQSGPPAEQTTDEPSEPMSSN